MNVPSTNAMVFAANKRTYYDRSSSHNKYHKPSSNNSFTKSYSTSYSKRHSMYFCDHCKIAGHTAERCF